MDKIEGTKKAFRTHMLIIKTLRLKIPLTRQYVNITVRTMYSWVKYTSYPSGCSSLNNSINKDMDQCVNKKKTILFVLWSSTKIPLQNLTGYLH